MRNAACPSDEQLAELLCAEGDHSTVAAHLEDCADCQQRLDRLVAQEPVPSWAREALDRTAERSGAGPDPAFLSALRTLVPRVVSSAVEVPPTSPPSAPEPCPTRLGTYDILGEIGRGGMAVVYKARQPVIGRVVALKRLRLRDHEAADVARFLREAESLARVPHPNIVQVFEVGEDDGRPFLVLEFVGGGTLAEFIGASAPVEPRAAAEFVEKVARAVHHAHAHGVIHRDLKPTNILLAAVEGRPPAAGRPPALADYEPKVADFGLARLIGDDRGLTHPDVLAGTPAYLAPEQLHPGSGPPAPAGDVYALGVILYEMLTARPPLLGPTALATLVLVETVEPVPPRRLQPQLPRDLEAVCLKCLAKDPRRRYSTAGDLATDLARFLAGKPTVARPLSAPARAVKLIGHHPWAAAVAAVFVSAVACGVAGILWQWRAAERARTNLQSALDAEAEQRRDAEENLYYGRLAQTSALWENGEAARARALLAACAPAPGRVDLRGWEWHYLNRQFRPELHVFQYQYWINGIAPVPAPAGPAAEVALAIGRPRKNAADTVQPGDGRTGFLRALDPTAELRPGPALPGAATALAVHPAGKFVAWGTNSGAIVVGRGSTGEIVRTITAPAPVSRVRFSHDGAMIFATGEDAHLRAYDPETGALVSDVPARVGRPWELAIHPEGAFVAVGGGTGVVRLFDPRGSRPSADLTGHTGGVTALCLSPSGAVLAAGCADGSVVLWSAGARQELGRIPSSGGPAYALAVRGDENALAVGGADRTVRVHDFATLRVQATYRGHESSVRSLAFAPGDAHLLSGGQDGSVRVWDATRDVRGRLLPFHPALNDAAFQMSPAGPRVVAASTERLVRTWAVADGSVSGQFAPSITRRAPYPRRYCVLLNDGRLLAGIDRDDPNVVALFDVVTGAARNRFTAGTGPIQVLGTDHNRRLLVWATAAEGGVDVHWRTPDSEAQPPPVRLDTRAVVALAVEPHSGQIAAVTAGRSGAELALWVIDIAGAWPPREVTRGTTMYGGLAFNPDGSRLAVSVDDAIQIYRTNTWERAHNMPLAPMTGLTFSPDGRRLAAIGYDGHATLFDPLAGKRVFELRSLAPGRPDEMAADARVAFSPDGSWLLSTNWDGSLNVWDGRPIRE
jgi:serine/threonine protein kinase/WD40 repeat protein